MTRTAIRIGLITGAFLFAWSSPAGASETPEQVADRYLGAIVANDWDAAAGLMHPEALQALRAAYLPLATSSVQWRKQVLGIADSSEVARLSDVAFYSSFMRNGGAQAFLLLERWRTLGHLQEGADTVHVVYRIFVEGRPFSIGTLGLRRSDDTWLGLLPQDMKGFAEFFQEDMKYHLGE